MGLIKTLNHLSTDGIETASKHKIKKIPWLVLYFWLPWVSAASVRAFSICSESGWPALQCVASLAAEHKPGMQSSVAVAPGLECGLCGMQDLPRPEIEPMSPALASFQDAWL